MLLSNATYSIMGLLICKYEPSDKKSKSSDTQVPVKARQPLVWTYMWIFMPPRSKIGGHIVFVLSVILSFCHSVILSFCNSVLLSETLTLLITFEQWVLELWFFTWVFLVIRPFRGYHYFLPCDLDLGVWAIFWN